VILNTQREEEEEEKEAFVPAFWVDAPRAFAAAAVRVVRLFFFLRGAFVVFVIQSFEKEEKDLQF
jgi:hypothetical protein|tara:strand:+ start:89 stop:283 length:195 start_codon:yes stop_codon:yes gene_type:complete